MNTVNSIEWNINIKIGRIGVWDDTVMNGNYKWSSNVQYKKKHIKNKKSIHTKYPYPVVDEQNISEWL